MVTVFILKILLDIWGTMNKAIMKSINYLEENIENFMRKELLLTDKNDQLKSFGCSTNPVG